MSLEAPRATREVKRWWRLSVVVRSLRDPQGGVHEQALQSLQKAGEAVGQAIDQDAAHDGGDVEQDELGHAPCRPPTRRRR